MRRSWCLRLSSNRADLVDGVLDVAGDVGRKDRTSVHRLRH